MNVMKFFNTAGPVNCQDHYCLSPIHRFDFEEVMSLIEQKKYFILHAPRQTGKTSCLLALMKYINSQNRYKCLYINVEGAQGAKEDVYRGIRSILGHMKIREEIHLKETIIGDIASKILEETGEDQALNSVLVKWSMKSNLPTILLIDEIDSLVGDTLISVLRQIRSGYDNRPEYFPQSVIFCGVRDVRDYRIHSSKEKEIITGGSAFNIKAESLRLDDFTKQGMIQLYKYHTDESGQEFTEEALDEAWLLSNGQPWVVNALGYEVCFKMKQMRDRSKIITKELIQKAGDNLILRRETHIDQLIDKLHEKRVQKIIEPILINAEKPEDTKEDDILYVRDLGLIKTDGEIRIANKLYMEIIPRALSYPTQLRITHETAWYIDKNGLIDIKKLMASFQDFYRKHFDEWSIDFQYKESSVQLLIQAYLQRIINSGGYLFREYALGRKRTDLLLIWTKKNPIQQVVIELKIRYKKTDSVIQEGLEQTWKYMDKCGAKEGHLVIFDRRTSVTWEQKIFHEKHVYNGQHICVWGM